MMVQKRITGRRWVRWVAVILATALLLLILAIVFVQTPYGQKVVKNQAEKYLRNKLHTQLSVASLRINFLSGVHLTGLYLEDQQKDTLLSVDKLDISYD